MDTVKYYINKNKIIYFYPYAPRLSIIHPSIQPRRGGGRRRRWRNAHESHLSHLPPPMSKDPSLFRSLALTWRRRDLRMLRLGKRISCLLKTLRNIRINNRTQFISILTNCKHLTKLSLQPTLPCRSERYLRSSWVGLSSFRVRKPRRTLVSYSVVTSGCPFEAFLCFICETINFPHRLQVSR